MSVNEYQIVKDLGKGAFAEVKLCRKYTGGVPPVSPEEKDFKSLSAQESLDDAKDLFVSHFMSVLVVVWSSQLFGRGEHCRSITSFAAVCPSLFLPCLLQAIKIFSKSILTRRRSFQRTNNGRMAVTTDLDKVQKEIAIMKKLVHPNLVRLFEVSKQPGQ